MDTVARLKELARERGLSLLDISNLCGVAYSTLKSAAARNSQLSYYTIDAVCQAIDIPIWEFFMTDEDWDGIEAYVLERAARRGKAVRQ